MATNNEKSVNESTEKIANLSLNQLEGRYFLVDIGANLTNNKYSRDLQAVVERSKNAGVQRIIVTGTCVQSSREALRLTHLFPSYLYCTAGVHPHDAKLWTDETYREIREIATNNPECVAIGECGLDFNRNFSPPDVQMEVFEKQVQLACELKKPLFVHDRESHQQMVDILSKYLDKLPPTVIHCFTGTIDEVKKYLELGFYIGLTGFLWKDKSDNGVRKILEKKIIPLDRLLVETDSPFMFPNVRGSKIPEKVKSKLTETSCSFLNRYCSFNKNEPCSLPITVEMIAAFSDMKPEEVALKTSYNALKIFGLSE